MVTVRLAWRADRAMLAAVVVAQIALGATTAVAYVATQRLLTGMFTPGAGLGTMSSLLPMAMAVTCALLARGLCGALSTVATGRLGPRITRLAHVMLMRETVHAELAAVEDAEFHNLLHSARRGADAAQQVTELTIGIFSGLMSIVAAGSVLASLDPLLLPLLLLALAPRAWEAARTARAVHASVHRWTELARQSDLLTTLMSHRDSAEEVRAHQVGGFLLGHYERLAAHTEREQVRLARVEAGNRLFAGGIAGLASVFTYGLLLVMVLTARMPLAVAGTAAVAVQAASASLASLMMQARPLYERGLYVLDWRRARERAILDGIPAEGVTPAAVPSVITARELRFAYPGSSRSALDGVDVEMRLGEVIALVGGNGSGKTTLAKLLTGLYLPSSGDVRWDGVATRDLDRRALFDRISLVSQDFVRWPFTARMNVAIGRAESSIDDDGLRRAVAAAGVEHTVAALDAGWDTLLAREFFGGTDLSGGQWQRLGLARAWYRDAPVLVVDEPTSALDPACEIEVFDRLRKLADDGRIVILITHRLASVARADRIYVMDLGKVKERGDHHELLRAGGHYATMYRLQAAQYGVG